jgi:RNA polymerase sigma-70 factor (ECF subfamily)
MSINSLYELIRNGDIAAEKQLFEEMTARFRYFVYPRIRDSMDAEEIVQEALVTISKEYKTLEIESSFIAWSYKVLDNRILGYIQSKRRQAKNIDRLKANMESSRSSDAESPGELNMKLLDCLKKIANANMRYARILNFNYQGYSSNEICGKLNITTSNLYSILSRARSMMRRCLDSGDIHR